MSLSGSDRDLTVFGPRELVPAALASYDRAPTLKVSDSAKAARERYCEGYQIAVERGLKTEFMYEATRAAIEFNEMCINLVPKLQWLFRVYAQATRMDVDQLANWEFFKDAEAILYASLDMAGGVGEAVRYAALEMVDSAISLMWECAGGSWSWNSYELSALERKANQIRVHMRGEPVKTEKALEYLESVRAGLRDARALMPPRPHLKTERLVLTLTGEWGIGMVYTIADRVNRAIERESRDRPMYLRWREELDSDARRRSPEVSDEYWERHHADFSDDAWIRRNEPLNREWHRARGFQPVRAYRV